MKTTNELKKMIGYKFYKVADDDSVSIIRLIETEDFNNKVKVKDGDKTKNISLFELKQYTPLEPTGFIMFIRALMNKDTPDESEDVIVSLYRMLDVKLEMIEPYAVCRQSVSDFFYTIMKSNPEHDYVGVSVTRENCPTNIPYQTLMACDDILKTDMVNFYLDDTLDDILNCLDTADYDLTLNKCYLEHMKTVNPMYIESLDKNDEDHGWCRNLQKLLEINNFINDIDTMRNVTALEFNLSKYLEKKQEFKDIDDESEIVYQFNDIMLRFFNYIFKIHAVDTDVILYDYDIDLGEFRNSNYIFMRDISNKTYLVVYKTKGEYLEEDLIEEFNKLGVSDRLRLAYINKYSEQNQE